LTHSVVFLRLGLRCAQEKLAYEGLEESTRRRVLLKSIGLANDLQRASEDELQSQFLNCPTDYTYTGNLAMKAM
jgi:hypothetical protein